MLENKDQAIKLFGFTIGSRIEASISTDVSCECTSCEENLLSSKQSKNRGNEGCLIVEPMDMNQEDESSTTSTCQESKTPSTITEIPKIRSNNKDSLTQDLAQKVDQSDQTSTTTHSDSQNPPKKPEEILPCRRCKSMNTKFCYFNNYNVNQPRHFCKNCQRYWTAGGCMRNLPMGSGRRKSKSKTSSMGFQPNSPTGQEQYWPMGPNSGGTTSPNGPMRPKMMENQGKDTPQGFIPPQMPCYPTSNWHTYAWNPIPWQSGYPLPFYSPSTSPQWLCHFVPNPSIYPNPNSHPFLGKHSRDGTLLVPSNNEEPTKEKTSENSMPTTFRIVDDPIEVARSSVWGSLEVEKDKARSSNIGGGFFQGFDQNQYKGVHPSGDQGSHIANQANPAAFCRSLSFHEVGEQGC